MLHVEDVRGQKPVMRRSGKLRYGLAVPDFAVAPAVGSGASLFRTELVRRHRFSDRFDGYVLGEDLDLSVRVSQDAPVIGTNDVSATTTRWAASTRPCAGTTAASPRRTFGCAIAT